MVLSQKRRDLGQMLGSVLCPSSTEAVEQVTQRSSGCLILGNVQGWIGWDLEQSGLVEDKCWNSMNFEVPSTSSRFYDFYVAQCIFGS